MSLTVQGDYRTAPISSLPTELLSCIFETGLELSSELHYRLSFPRTIVQVSRGWRATALATSQLWTTLTLREVHAGWLEKSRERPLDLFLDLTDMSENSGQSLLDVLLPHARRWRLLDIYDPVASPFLWDLTSCPTPCLERLWISTGGPPPIWKSPLLELGDRPKLTELRTSCMRVQASPLKSVTTFHLRYYAWQAPLDLRSFCALCMSFESLTTLVMQGPVLDLDSEDGSTVDLECVANLPLLTVLVIEFFESLSSYLVPLLGAINAPILNTLVLRIQESEDDWDSGLDGLALLSSKFPALRTLNLRSDFTINVMYPWTKNPFTLAFPDITSLIISSCTHEPITIDPVEAYRWPKLRTLTIGRGLGMDQFVPDFAAFIHDGQGGSHLETLRMEPLEVWGESAADLLTRELRAVGAQLQVEELDSGALDKAYERWVPPDFLEI
ncbi:hypothetical protein PLICRDRAFT_35431 [Plicaturopsis crispa FD-325 SS-3]|nr:hypothetical protein PLICRDRAFT_35431 [Plicaturopsis crispa FD-325 SS-3]